MAPKQIEVNSCIRYSWKWFCIFKIVLQEIFFTVTSNFEILLKKYLFLKSSSFLYVCIPVICLLCKKFMADLVELCTVFIVEDLVGVVPTFTLISDL